ncbi:MAG: oxidoreductase [Rhodocyclaceae bacterium]|nr:MAG: oxidoreductase [Rhodocyclaceae bacterium]
MVEVVNKKILAEGIAQYDLMPVERNSLPMCSAGAHIDVYLPNGIIRQYSLCEIRPEADKYVIAVLLDPKSRGGSRWMHEELSIGAQLRISEPKNLFPLNMNAKKFIFLAGGIGITPILAMAYAVESIGGVFELHYCARSKKKMAFHDRIAQSAFKGKAHFYWDDEKNTRALQLNELLSHPSPDVHLYVCGPKGFIDAAVLAAAEMKWSKKNVHFEHFSNAAVNSENGGVFSVRLASSGKCISVGSKETIAAALRREGVTVPLSCEQGVCGTCLIPVISGVPDHRDLYLSDNEKARNDKITVCCSRSLSAELVLDL